MLSYRPTSFPQGGKNKRIVNMCFLVNHYENVYNDILGRSFTMGLDEMAFIVYLKMKYYNDSGGPVIITTDMREDCLIHETILRNPIETIAALGKRKKNIALDVVDLDVREDRILQDNELGLYTEVKTNLKADFEW